MDDEMDELLGEFLIESFENLDQLDQDLIALEHDPSDCEILKSIFRTVHTVKGTCGFLALHKLEAITHVGENLLSLLRDGTAHVDAEIANALLALSDAIRAVCDNLQQTQSEGETDYSALVSELERLEAVASGKAEGEEGVPVSQPSTAGAPRLHPPVAIAEPEAVDSALPEVELPRPTVIPTPDDVWMSTEIEGASPLVGEILVRQGVVSEVDVAIGLIQQADGDGRRIGEILIDAGAVSPEALSAAVAVQSAVKATVVDSTLRVDVGILDQLMTLVGELVLARNQLLQITSLGQTSPELVTTTQRLNAITSELQNGVMKTRMQPVGTVWSKFPRVARDVATACGKQVRVEMEGKDIELDKTIIEAIKDPLTHVIRNSIDHGIETPEVRAERGKPAEGVVLLRAYHEGGQVNIEIVDDGGGIDIERVKSKAIEKALITPEVAATMSDRDATNLVFLPGFSTADEVSNISGRGVGMDVVRTNIEKIGGSIDLYSAPLCGSTLRIRIPLTLAIIPALVVSCAGEKFVIPQVSLVELVGLDVSRLESEIETVHQAPVFRLRDKLIPLLYLQEQLGLAPSEAANSTIVVLRCDDQEFGLVVDCVNDSEEIVVKPRSAQLRDLAIYCGCTIMGDGKVALILDVAGIARAGGVMRDRFDERADAVDSLRETTAWPLTSLLVATVGEGQRIAVPLAEVDRLEEFDRSSVEYAHGQQVVQYRGSMLPLIDVGATLGQRIENENQAILQVVVCTLKGALIGLVVCHVLDIVDHADEVEYSSGEMARPARARSAVIQGRVTDLIRVDELYSMSGLSAHQSVVAAQEGSYV